MSNTSVEVEQVLQQVEGFIQMMKSTRDFRPNPDFRAARDKFVTLYTDGDDKLAMVAGRQLIESGRKSLSAYIRHAAMDWVKDGEPRTSMYFEELKIRRERGYDPDILARLAKFHKKLMEAIHAETNGTFVARVEAYNALREAFKEADAEFAKREKGRSAAKRKDRAERLMSLV